MEPPVKCAHSLFASTWDACTCTVVLPPSIHQVPQILPPPIPQGTVMNPDAPTFPPPVLSSPPLNPMRPYAPPPLLPTCPFATKCMHPENPDCVGFNSWGFAEAKMASYMPGAAYFNSISCSYIMNPPNVFTIPTKVKERWARRDMFKNLAILYKSTLNIVCGNVSYPSVYGDFCQTVMVHERTPCTVAWGKLWQGPCLDAPPPEGLKVTSLMSEVCPKECKTSGSDDGADI